MERPPGDHRGYGPSSRRREEDDGWGRRYGRREEAGMDWMFAVKS